jgi:hypothetical protein
VAGKAIGFVPHHWAMIAGTLMQTGAQVGNHVLAKTLSDRVLRVANRDYFGPRRLAVRVPIIGGIVKRVIDANVQHVRRPSRLTRCCY